MPQRINPTSVPLGRPASIRHVYPSPPMKSAASQLIGPRERFQQRSLCSSRTKAAWMLGGSDGSRASAAHSSAAALAAACRLAGHSLAVPARLTERSTGSSSGRNGGGRHASSGTRGSTTSGRRRGVCCDSPHAPPARSAALAAATSFACAASMASRCRATTRRCRAAPSAARRPTSRRACGEKAPAAKKYKGGAESETRPLSACRKRGGSSGSRGAAAAVCRRALALTDSRSLDGIPHDHCADDAAADRRGRSVCDVRHVGHNIHGSRWLGVRRRGTIRQRAAVLVDDLDGQSDHSSVLPIQH